MDVHSHWQVIAFVTLTACAGNTPPPASPPASGQAGTSDGSQSSLGATELQGRPKMRTELEDELSKMDDALTDIARRLQVGQDSAQVELQQQLAILQQRDADLRAQLQSTNAQADADSERVRRAVQGAITLLDRDMKQLEKRVTP
jgi:hypothetical protein